MVTMIYRSPASAGAEAEAHTVEFGDKTVITIGRDSTNDVVLDAPIVSRFHARIERVGQRYRVRDLRSANGTFVDDEQIEGEVWLKPEDSIRIGPYRFVMGQDQLAQYDETGGLRVDALGLNKWVRKDLNILQNISLVFKPREFIVVVGQSGGGKSTLIDAIAGYRPATHGKVFVNDIDVYRNFNAIRNDIGYVPQRDIIHTELTVFQALDYTAQLRMPADTSKAERHKRIEEVLQDLDLAHRKDVVISGLSGGQQKRVSIGVELLTKPGLFFLDEPTSGLDPGTETALMQLMRRLADQGRTIILITHATKNVMLADKVVFLSRGGYLAWFGPPDEALEYFDQFRSERDRRALDIEFDEIYAILGDPGKGEPENWAERFQQHPAYQQYISQPLQDKVQTPAAGQSASSVPASVAGHKARRHISSLRQFTILSARNIKILTRDKFSLGLMLAAAPLVALLDVILSLALGRNPFDFNDGFMANVLITLFLLTVYGVMVGGLAQMREIVKEQEVYKRERLVNLRIVPYILSKTWFAALLALYVTTVYVIVHYLAFDMPGGAVEFGIIYVSLALATMAGMMLGLFASAVAPNSNSAPLIVILLMLPQIVLGGALVPLPEFVSAPTSTRWAFQAFMAATGPGSHVAADTCWQLPDEQLKELLAKPIEEKDANCRCMGTNAVHEETCNFPGNGSFYSPAIDEPPPPEPGEPPQAPGDRPAEPALPPEPEEPADDTDLVAISDYQDAIKAWRADVEQVQDNYRAEIADYETEIKIYQAQLEAYQAEVVDYQTNLARWEAERFKAAGPAEQIIAQYNRDFGWLFVNKDDAGAYWSTITTTWLAQGFIIVLLFVTILILQKRKDVT
jgi:ABC-type multidrug transport system ATPase subunit